MPRTIGEYCLEWLIRWVWRGFSDWRFRLAQLDQIQREEEEKRKGREQARHQ